MKKRTIIIIVIAAALLLAAASVTVFIWKPWKVGDEPVGMNIEPGTPLHEALFWITNKDDIAIVEKAFDIKATLSESDYLFNDVDCFGEKMSFIYTFTSDEYLDSMGAYALITAEAGKEKDKCVGLINSFSSLFGVPEPTSYLIYSETGVLDNTASNSYADIFQGKAILEFKVRDQEATFWILKIQNTGSDRVLCSISHYMNSEQYADKIANLDLM